MNPAASASGPPALEPTLTIHLVFHSLLWLGLSSLWLHLSSLKLRLHLSELPSGLPVQVTQTPGNFGLVQELPY